ncbi:auxin transporter-like protein 3 isoform X1 [Selaginella moellendorffii]|uniref:auxin transporter-like protein 3 isoform X1 n=1 Tax=Selaginella moellendorffii TaxID=88036 RepID=UPI000D1C95B1|nr:auxin transporter-like protein 3 isoform X1 [Selaginella moellendorffii]|eukprot:XP_024514857.1 auxin transporter-like protein 3 isoform X1 [Selaginella moellendorffii]
MSATKSWDQAALRLLWHGGSTFDAWLNIVAAKLASRLLTFPQSTAQLGLPSAIVFQLLLSAMGLWSQSAINVLYLRHKRMVNPETTANQPWHTTQVQSKSFRIDHLRAPQLHEVIGGLLGSKWKIVSLVFNIVTLFYVSSAQLIACSNVAYTVNDNLDKRTWTFVFGAIFSLPILFPSAHNYRVWSFLGVVTIIFDSAYMTIATLFDRKAGNVSHSSPRSSQEYFTGLVGMLILGNVPIPVEIMDAMWKPDEYQAANLYGMACILVVVMLPSISMERKFGDKLLATPNAMLLLPRSKFHDSANVLILLHVVINFGMYSLALYATWEKIVRIHDSPSYVKRTLSRIPVFLALWITALAFPFFGAINKLLDAILVSWNFFIIPCAAYIAVFWLPRPRRGSKSLSRLGWGVDLSVCLGIILWMLVMQCGLGLWGDVHTFVKVLEGTRPFPKCYRCAPPK